MLKKHHTFEGKIHNAEKTSYIISHTFLCWHKSKNCCLGPQLNRLDLVWYLLNSLKALASQIEQTLKTESLQIWGLQATLGAIVIYLIP